MSEFEEGQHVRVKFPLPGERYACRAEWPWLPGWIEEVCGPDEWSVVVKLAIVEETLGSAEDGDMVYPVCFRDRSEIRAAG